MNQNFSIYKKITNMLSYLMFTRVFHLFSPIFLALFNVFLDKKMLLFSRARIASRLSRIKQSCGRQDPEKSVRHLIALAIQSGMRFLWSTRFEARESVRTSKEKARRHLRFFGSRIKILLRRWAWKRMREEARARLCSREETAKRIFPR